MQTHMHAAYNDLGDDTDTHVYIYVRAYNI